MTQQILINPQQLSGGYNRMHAVVTLIEVKEIENTNRNIVLSFTVDKIISGYTISGLENTYQAYFPSLDNLERVPYSYDRLVESLADTLVADEMGMLDLRQLVGKRYVITIQEADYPGKDNEMYVFKNLINLVPYDSSAMTGFGAVTQHFGQQRSRYTSPFPPANSMQRSPF